MLDRTPADFWARGCAETQRVSQLIQEHRDAVIDLRLCGGRDGPRGRLGPAPPDDLIPIDSNEFLEHRTSQSVSDRNASAELLMSETAQAMKGSKEDVGTASASQHWKAYGQARHVLN